MALISESTRKPTWHEIPRPAYRSDDATRHARSLCSHLQPWFDSALLGELRHLPRNGLSAYPKSAEDTICDCAGVLAASVEWEGFLMATEFAQRGWPADYDLVQRCNRWSCDRKKARIELYHAQQSRKQAGGRP